MPEFISMKIPYIHSFEDKGVRALVLYEVESNRLQEAYEIIRKTMVPCLTIPGFSFFFPFLWFFKG
jgi:hypothetical protein